MPKIPAFLGDIIDFPEELDLSQRELLREIAQELDDELARRNLSSRIQSTQETKETRDEPSYTDELPGCSSQEATG